MDPPVEQPGAMCRYLQEQTTMMEMDLVQMHLMVEQKADYSMMSMRTTANLQP